MKPFSKMIRRVFAKPAPGMAYRSREAFDEHRAQWDAIGARWAAIAAEEERAADELTASMPLAQARELFQREQRLELSQLECGHEDWIECDACQEAVDREYGPNPPDYAASRARRRAVEQVMNRDDPTAVAAAAAALQQARERVSAARTRMIESVQAGMTYDEARVLMGQQEAYEYSANFFPRPDSRQVEAARRVVASGPGEAISRTQPLPVVPARLGAAGEGDADGHIEADSSASAVDPFERLGQAMRARQALGKSAPGEELMRVEDDLYRAQIEVARQQVGPERADRLMAESRAALDAVLDEAGREQSPRRPAADNIAEAHGRARILDESVDEAWTLENTPRGFINPGCDGDEDEFDDYSDRVGEREAALRAHLLANPELERDEEFSGFYAQYREEAAAAEDTDAAADAEAAEASGEQDTPDQALADPAESQRLISGESRADSGGPLAPESEPRRHLDGGREASMRFGFVGPPASAGRDVSGELDQARTAMGELHERRAAEQRQDTDEQARTARVQAWMSEPAPSTQRGDDIGWT